MIQNHLHNEASMDLWRHPRALSVMCPTVFVYSSLFAVMMAVQIGMLSEPTAGGAMHAVVQDVTAG